VKLGQEIRIRVWVKNAGNADSGPFEVDADFDPCQGLAQGRRWFRVDNLKPGEEVQRDFTHKFLCIGFKTLSLIEIDRANQVVESDEHNNIKHLDWLFRVGKFVTGH
jgi:subtilase family serine protease